MAQRLQVALGAAVWIGTADADVLRGRTEPKTVIRKVLKRLLRVSLPADSRELEGINDKAAAARTVSLLADRIKTSSIEWVCSGHSAVDRTSIS